MARRDWIPIASQSPTREAIEDILAVAVLADTLAVAGMADITDPNAQAIEKSLRINEYIKDFLQKLLNENPFLLYFVDILT